MNAVSGKKKDLLLQKKYAPSYYEEIVNVIGSEQTEILWKKAVARYEQMVQDNRQLPEKVRAHTEGMIFPAIAVYQELQNAVPKQAMGIMEKAESRVSLKTGNTYRILTAPGFMRRIFLKIFSKGSKSGFSEESGFLNQPQIERPEEIAFAIRKCPYHDYCVKYDCPELVHIFCQNDSNAYGNLPGIVFERHETLGTGGTCCDFHLYLKKQGGLYDDR